MKAGPENGDRFETAGYDDLWTVERACPEGRARAARLRRDDQSPRSPGGQPVPADASETLAHEVAPHCPPVAELDARAARAGTDVEIAGPPPTRAGSASATPGSRREPQRSRGSGARLRSRRRGSSSSPVAVAGRRRGRSERRRRGRATTTSRRSRRDEADDRVDDEPPWRRGRAGTAIGRAVHAVLQTVDLATGDGADTLSVAQAAAEGVPALAGEIERRVRQRARVAERQGSRRDRPLLARGVPRRARSKAACSRASSTCCTRTPTASSSSSTTRPTACATRPTRTKRWRAIGCRAAAYALAVSSSLGRPVSRVRVRVRQPDAVVRARASPTWRPRAHEVEGLVGSA